MPLILFLTIMDWCRYVFFRIGERGGCMPKRNTATGLLGTMSGMVLGLIVGEQVGKATLQLLIGLALGLIAGAVLGQTVSMMLRRR